MNLFYDFMYTEKKRILKIILLIIFSSLIGIPLPYISKLLIDNVLISGNYDYVKVIFIYYIAILFIQIFLGRISAIENAEFISVFNTKLRKSLFDNNLKFFSKFSNLNSLQTIMVNDIELLCHNVLHILMVFFSNITILTGYLFVIFSIHPKLSIISLLFVPIYIFWLIHISEKLKVLSKQLQVSKEDVLKGINNTFTNIWVVKLYGLINKARDRFFLIINQNVNISKEIIVYNNFVSIISGVIMSSAAFVPLFIGINYVKIGELTIGELMAFNSYCSLLFTPITSLLQIMTTYKTTQVYEQRYNDAKIIFQESINSNETGVNSNPKKGLMSSNNLNVYIRNKILVRNVCLNIDIGDVIRLRGANGSGKSLLLQCLVQLNKNYTGTIYYNNESINQFDSETISNEVLYVSNDQGLFLDTFLENMTSDKAQENRNVIKVLKEVNLLDFIKDRSGSLLIKKEEMEKQFSNGEMQKFRIARALLKKPKILILDEIFSNIDSEQTKFIFNNLKINYPEMSIIFVEHHLDSEIDYEIEWEIVENKLIVRRDKNGL